LPICLEIPIQPPHLHTSTQELRTLPLVLEKYLRFGIRHVSGDSTITHVPLLNPKDFELLVDIFALEPRVHFMLKKTDLTVNQRLAGERYVWAMGQVRQGRDPSSMRDFD